MEFVPSEVFGRPITRYSFQLIKTLHNITGREIQPGVGVLPMFLGLVSLEHNVNATERRMIEYVLIGSFGDVSVWAMDNDIFLGIPQPGTSVSLTSAQGQESADRAENTDNRDLMSVYAASPVSSILGDHSQAGATTADTTDDGSVGGEFFNEGEKDESADENRHIKIYGIKNCDFCYQDKPLGEFPKSPSSPGCSHGTEYCIECEEESVIYQMKDRQWQQIRCDLCQNKLPSDTIKRHVDANTFSIFLDYMSTYRIRKEKDFHWCQNLKCTSGQIEHPSEESSEMMCHKCGYASCITCEALYHTGKTCEEYQISFTAEKSPEKTDASIEFIKTSTQKCPECQVDIERSGGCEDMSCTSCGAVFQWKILNAAAEEEEIDDHHPLPRDEIDELFWQWAA